MKIRATCLSYLMLCLPLAACAMDATERDGAADVPEEMTELAALLRSRPVGADPAALFTDGEMHIYTTSQGGLNVPHYAGATPPNLTTLGAATEALPDSQRGLHLSGGVWAPTVRQVGPDDYVMWYSGELDDANTTKCLWRARASRPEGPFRRVGAGQPLCPDPHWNLDPYLIKDSSGFWLYSKVSGHIHRRKLNDDGATFAPGSAWRDVLAPTAAWEQGSGQDRPLVENPALVRMATPSGASRWLLFYASNSWPTRDYAIGYADCGGGVLPGACTKKTTERAWMNRLTPGAPRGPGAAAFFTYQAKDYMVIHGWKNRCDAPADDCATRTNHPCVRGAEDQDCRFENPDGRQLYLYRASLDARGNPIATAL